MNVLSLCSGIGGLDLAVKWAIPEARTVGYIEIDPFCQTILCARMDDGWLDRAPIWPDLRTFDGRAWRGIVDCLSAGFPCQPFSVAGRRRGATDERNLWPDVRRVIAESDPAVVVLENVPGALPYFYHVVLPELSGLGYAAQAGLFTAAEVGAPHRRQRLFVLAHREIERWINASDQADSRATQGRGRSRFVGHGGSVGFPTRQHNDGGGCPGAGWGPEYSDDEFLPWPPGPAERDQWAAILAVRPDLAPAMAIASREQMGSARLARADSRNVADPANRRSRSAWSGCDSRWPDALTVEVGD